MDAYDPEGGTTMATKATKSKLGEQATFEGKPVLGVSIEVRGVSGGLNKAVAIDPVVLLQGDEAIVAFRVDTDKIRHDPVEKDNKAGPQTRVQILEAETAAVLTGAVAKAVGAVLDSQQAKIDEFEAQAEAERERLKEDARRAAEIEKNRAKGQEPIVEADGTVNPAAKAAKPARAPRARKRVRKATH